MYTITKLYPATQYNSALMEEIAIGAPAQSSVFMKYARKSFMLIDDQLVPTAFLDRLDKHPMAWNAVFEEDAVYTARELVGEDFWFSLTNAERRVLGACLLILIEQGRVVLEFPATKEKVA